MGLLDTLSETPAAAPATEAATDNVSLDQLISEAVAAAPAEQETPAADTEQPSAAETGQPVNGDPVAAAAASVEGTSTAKPGDKPAAAEPAKEQPSDDAVSVRRARQILAEANRKEQQARQAVAAAEQELIKQLIANPRNFLAKHGKSLAELIDIDLGQEHDPVKDEPKAVKPEDVAKLVADAVKQALKERDQVSALDARKNEIRGDIAKDSRFPMINKGREAETVLEFMETYYNTHGKAIPWDKAAHLVEQELRGKWGEPAAATAAAPAKVPQRESTAREAALSAATSKPATTTTLTNNEIRSAGPPDDAEPTDPDQLIRWLVAKEEKRQAAQAQ